MKRIIMWPINFINKVIATPWILIHLISFIIKNRHRIEFVTVGNIYDEIDEALFMHNTTWLIVFHILTFGWFIKKEK